MSYQDDLYWAKKSGGVYGNRFKMWSKFEEQELADMWNEGGLIPDIAEVLERSEKAVAIRLTVLRDKGLL